MNRRITIEQRSWRLKKPFVISRNTRLETHTITVTIHEGDFVGSGESVPSPRYGESCSTVITQIKKAQHMLANGLTRKALQGIMPAGAARNAVDAALWDLEAKIQQTDVSVLSGITWPQNINSVQTISILSAEEMGEEAKYLKNFPILKVKLNADSILARLRAVHENAPKSKLIIDANESWPFETLCEVAPKLVKLGVVMIEQPLAAGKDNALLSYQCPLPIYADESCHSRADMPDLIGKYDGINIKLDKTGGLTEALLLMEKARSLGFEIMTGCMLSTSLGMAPATFVASKSKYVDLDASMLLAEDRKHGLTIEDGSVSTLNPLLWGGSSN